MGLANELKRVGYSMRELRIVDARGQRITGFGTRVFRELTGGRFITLGRADLARLLFETVKDETEILFGDEMVGLEERPDQMRAQFRNAGARPFDLVVGADGLHSNVRRLARAAAAVRKGPWLRRRGVLDATISPVRRRRLRHLPLRLPDSSWPALGRAAAQTDVAPLANP